MKYISTALASGILALPQSAAALVTIGDLEPTTTLTIKGIVTFIIESILSPIVPFLIGLAVVVFLWGLAMYLGHAGNEQKRSQGASLMVGGIIAIAIMLTFWGLAVIISSSFGFYS